MKAAAHIQFSAAERRKTKREMLAGYFKTSEKKKKVSTNAQGDLLRSTSKTSFTSQQSGDKKRRTGSACGTTACKMAAMTTLKTSASTLGKQIRRLRKPTTGTAGGHRSPVPSNSIEML